MGKIKNMIKTWKTWLDINEAPPRGYTIFENKDFKTMCIINRIWLRGDAHELKELYSQLDDSKNTFWGSVASAGLEIKKTHSGLPQLIINKLTDIVVSDYNGIECENSALLDYWDEIVKETNFDDLLENIVGDAIGIGDGAIKYSYDKKMSEYPMLEWYSGDKVEFVYKRGKLIEIDFEDIYEVNGKIYKLIEKRGYGYINYELYDGDKQIPIDFLEKTKKLKNITFNNKVMLATQFMVDKSKRFKGRGASKLEPKHDVFDSLDEIISQWIEAIRSGRAKNYIPECLCPKDPDTGVILKPNSFDNKFILTGNNLREEAKNAIQSSQPTIPTENYLESYITYLGLCMQGLISPSTLGIDTKKIVDSNASYERQMEKTTMFTRSDIIKSLNVFIPKVVNTTWTFTKILSGDSIDAEEKITPKFSEFNSPSFDAQIETMAKARTNTVVSIETMVDELYGDSKTKEWKQEEIIRIKNELGISEMEEPSVNQDLNLIDGEMPNETSKEDDKQNNKNPKITNNE